MLSIEHFFEKVCGMIGMIKHSATHRYTIHTVKNALQILKLFSKNKPEWTLTEISTVLKINISTAHRLLATLEQKDYLRRDKKTKRYRLGDKLIHLANVVTSTMEIHREAEPILKDLAQKLKAAVHLGVLEGTEIVYLNIIETPLPTPLNSFIGKRNPSYCTGCGKVMLAFQKEAEKIKLIQKLEKQGFVPYGRNTVSTGEQLLNQLKRIRQQGYALCIDEYFEGFSIGAPVYDYTGEVIAAISATGRMHHMKETDFPTLIHEVIKASQNVSEKLGYIK